MKTVFTNRQCAHVWAQQSQDRGKTNNGNMFFEGRTIYSYGRHFPLATFYRGAILLNDSAYSVSTSGHQSDVRNALSHDDFKRAIRMNTRTISIFASIDENPDEQVMAGAALFYQDYIKENAERLIKSAAKRVKPSLAQSDINSAIDIMEHARAFYTLIELPFPAEFVIAVDELKTNAAGNLEKHKEQIKAEREAKKKREAERKERDKTYHDEMLAKFRRGEGYSAHDLSRYTNKIYMRIKGDDIETSKGAEFPVKHAIKVFEIVRLCRERETCWYREPHTFARLGNFEINRIDDKGNVTAGCHFVEWDEIERIARELNIYP